MHPHASNIPSSCWVSQESNTRRCQDPKCAEREGKLGDFCGSSMQPVPLCFPTGDSLPAGQDPHHRRGHPVRAVAEDRAAAARLSPAHSSGMGSHACRPQHSHRHSDQSDSSLFLSETQSLTAFPSQATQTCVGGERQRPFLPGLSDFCFAKIMFGTRDHDFLENRRLSCEQALTAAISRGKSRVQI